MDARSNHDQYNDVYSRCVAFFTDCAPDHDIECWRNYTKNLNDIAYDYDEQLTQYEKLIQELEENLASDPLWRRWLQFIPGVRKSLNDRSQRIFDTYANFIDGLPTWKDETGRKLDSEDILERVVMHRRAVKGAEIAHMSKLMKAWSLLDEIENILLGVDAVKPSRYNT